MYLKNRNEGVLAGITTVCGDVRMVTERLNE